MASILVVDDEPGIRRLLHATLASEHDLREAENGDEALGLLRVEASDILILDIAMPVMDGLAVCRAVRSDPALAGLGIIVVSAYALDAEALAAGADHYFRKPFRPLELLAMIDVLSTRAPDVRRLHRHDPPVA